MFLKMLEDHSKRHSGIIVQKKKRKVRRRKKTTGPEVSSNEESLEDKWANIASNLSAAVQGRRDIPSGISPFDGASQLTFEEQKVDAVYKIRGALLSNDAEQAVGLLRSARELWPEGDSFGAAEIESEDEFDVLREIYMSNLENPQQQNSASAPVEDELEETDEEESAPAYVEQKLEITEIYKKFASAKAVIPCCLLLKNYQSNTSRTNTCLIKLIHKIAWDCKMYALFFQASLFVTFQKIFEDPDISHNPIVKEFSRFAKFILSKFFETAEKNKKVFVEILFWKGFKEAYELEEGYGQSHPLSKKLAWTEEEDNELQQLYEENKNIYIEGQDVADIILANITDKRRTKNQIILALKRLGLIQNVRDLRPQLRKEWMEDECNELRLLYEKHNMAYDMLEDISNGLSIKRSKKMIVEKLLELNLIQDRAETKKKKHLKPKETKKGKSFISDNEQDDLSGGSDSEDQYLPVEERDLDKNIIDDSSDNDADEDFFKNLKKERSENHVALNLLTQNDDNLSVTDVQKNSKHEAKKETVRNKKIPEVWQEEEIIKLNALFNEYQGSDDIVNKILNSLTVRRSRQSITEKLLELGLIKDKKEVRKKRISKSSVLNGKKVNIGDSSEDDSLLSSIFNSHNSANSIVNKKKFRQIMSDSSDDENSKLNDVSNSGEKIKKQNTSLIADSAEKRKRPPKIWEEQEIIELQQLFEKHKDSNDIIGNIVNEKTVKRPKDSIIGKLLEIGLINDRKEVRKKRTSKINLPSINKKASSFDSKLQKSKNIKKLHLDSSSDDDTVPLNSLVKRNQEELNGGLSNVKNRKAINSASSDEEILREIQDYLDDSSGVIKEKVKTLENSLDKETGNKNGFEKKRISRVISDSSDDETVPLHNISNQSLHKNNNSSKFTAEQVFEKSITSDLLTSSEPAENGISLPLNSTDNHLTMKNDLDGDFVITNQKRKRFLISDSEDSNDESLLNPLSEMASNKKTIELGTEDVSSNTVEEPVLLQAVRKRARVLADSDESD